MTLDDELLTRAAREAQLDELGDLPEDALLDHVFSADFEQQIQRMARSRKKKLNWQRFARRAAVIVLALFVGASATVLSVEAWRERLFKLVEKKHPEYSDISYESVGGQPLPADFELVEYRPAYIPEGFRLTDQMLDDNVNWSSYRNAEGSRISFDQSVNAKEGFGMGMSINTEGSQLEPFDLNGDLAYKMSNMGTQFVLWNDDQYNYMITSDLSMEETLKIAESVTVCPKDAYHPPKLSPHYLPDDYSAEMARKNGDMVLVGEKAENTDTLKAFLRQMEAGTPCIMRLVWFTEAGDAIVTELYYDGFLIDCSIDSGRDRTADEKKTESWDYRSAQLVESDGFAELVLTGEDGAKRILCRYEI